MVGVRLSDDMNFQLTFMISSNYLLSFSSCCCSPPDKQDRNLRREIFGREKTSTLSSQIECNLHFVEARERERESRDFLIFNYNHYLIAAKIHLHLEPSYMQIPNFQLMQSKYLQVSSSTSIYAET
jgi:hypothetical protein